MQTTNYLADLGPTMAEAGWPIIPIRQGEKRPGIPGWQTGGVPSREQVAEWSRSFAGIGVLTGHVVAIDIDVRKEQVANAIEEAARIMLGYAPVRVGQPPKRLLVYRTDQPISKSSTAPYLFEGDERAHAVEALGSGQQFVAYGIHPDTGMPYEWLTDQIGDLSPMELTEVSQNEIENFLIAAGRILEENGAKSESRRPLSSTPSGSANPIPEGFRVKTLVSLAGNLRRIGMSYAEILAAISQTNQDRCRPPLPTAKIYDIAKSVSRYEPDQIATAAAEGHWDQDEEERESDHAHITPDPGPLPERLLSVPGFVRDVMDYTLQTAPYPNKVLAFAGALSLQAVLAGRKVRDPADNRTNLYILGLAHSAAGKDRPRKVNIEILNAVGLLKQAGSTFASKEGLEDALQLTPSMLYQTDEIDTLLRSINQSRDGRYESLVGTLLTLYSSASSVIPMRRKAGDSDPGVIDQPCLTVFGTAIPSHYYAALSERMLTNGLVARMLILESGPRGVGKRSRLTPLPQHILDTARWWASCPYGPGNLGGRSPEPRVVPYTPEGDEVLTTVQREADEEWNRAHARSDSVGTTIWGRVFEHICKLALLYSISRDHECPEIDGDAVVWAHSIVDHQTRRMLSMVQDHVAETPLEATALRVLRKVREARHQELPHSVLLKRSKLGVKEFTEIVKTLEQRGDLITKVTSTGGRTGRFYQARSGVKEGKEGE